LTGIVFAGTTAAADGLHGASVGAAAHDHCPHASLVRHEFDKKSTT
jgi:hypothetical protein